MYNGRKIHARIADAPSASASTLCRACFMELHEAVAVLEQVLLLLHAAVLHASVLRCSVGACCGAMCACRHDAVLHVRMSDTLSFGCA